ncbi:hypothetical protein T265_14808, partial [Opisthorchis viverrini]
MELLTRLMKTLRQPSTGFALLGAYRENQTHFQIKTLLLPLLKFIRQTAIAHVRSVNECTRLTGTVQCQRPHTKQRREECWLCSLDCGRLFRRQSPDSYWRCVYTELMRKQVKARSASGHERERVIGSAAHRQALIHNCRTGRPLKQ